MEWLQTNWLPVTAILYAALSEIIGMSPLKSNSVVQVLLAIMKKIIVRPLVIILLPLTFCLVPGSHAGTVDVTLAWDTSSGAVGYKLYYGTVSKTYTTMVDVKNVLTYKLTKLTCNPCYFAATAYDTQGLESDYSDEVSYARLRAPANFKTTAILVTLP